MVNKLSKYYVRYIIKAPFIFYSLLFVGIVIFLFMTLRLQLDVREIHTGYISNNEIIVQGEQKPISNIIYIYTDMNEDINKVTLDKIINENDKTIFILKDNMSNFLGNINVEFTVAKQSLLKRIFVDAGKG